MVLVDRLSISVAFSGHIQYWCFKFAMPALHVRQVQYTYCCQKRQTLAWRMHSQHIICIPQKISLLRLQLIQLSSSYLWALSHSICSLQFVLLFKLFIYNKTSVSEEVSVYVQPCGRLFGKTWPLGSLVCDVFFVLSLSHTVLWVRCGTWLYRFLIFFFYFKQGPLNSLLLNLANYWESVARITYNWQLYCFALIKTWHPVHLTTEIYLENIAY